MFASSVKRMKFLRALKSRPFAMIWIGQTISNLGDGIFYLALAWQVLLMTHSGTAMAIVLIAGIIPRLIFVLFGGVAADRLPRRLIILWSDGGRGVIVLLISILGFAGLLQFWHLLVQSFIFGVVDGFFNPAILAITPDLVEKEDLASANALVSLSGNVAQLVGPTVGAGFIALTGPMGAFAANALSFFISMAFLLSVRIPERHVTKPLEIQASAVEGSEIEGVQALEGLPEESPAGRKGMRGVLADVQEGLVYVRNSRWVWVTIFSAALGNVGIMASLVTSMPKLVHDVYGQGAWLLGLISTTGAIGSILALILIGQATRLKKRGLLAYLSITVSSIGLLIFGLPFPHAAAPFIAPLASILVDFGIAFFNTIYFTILQEMIPGDKLGRVISLDTLGSFAMIPVGEAVGGILTDRIGPATVFIIFGLFNIVNSLIPLLVREVREME
ncbi:MAG TPA: MFS transporter [Ktedonobacteraceae bacterium]|nr:MFS transporter [Ktedonobacteraceae bacterium]